MLNIRYAIFSPAFAAAALAGTMALAGPEGVGMRDTALGKVLTDADGMTLYIFDKDVDGVSACYDQCAVNWPPVLATAGAEAGDDFGLTERKDGSMQWTYDGMPLYLWVKDSAPGDTTGDGVNGVWHVALEK